MGWIGCARCEKFWRNIVAQTFALIAPHQPILHRVSCSNEMVPNAPKLYEMQQNISLGSNGVHLVRLLQKFRCNFVAWTFALIVPIRPVLHRVSCSKKMNPNAPKHYETYQNMSLGSNAVDRLHLLRIIPIWLHGINFALIAPVQFVLYRVYCRNETIPNAPKHYETRQNMSLGSYGLDWVRSLRKIPTRLRGTNFCTNCTSSARFAPSFSAAIKQSQMHQDTMKRTKTWGYGPMGWIGFARCEKLWRDFMAWVALIALDKPVLHRVYCRNKTIPNAPEHYKTRQNLSLGSDGLDRVCSLRKILTQLRGSNFCINCTNSAHFAPSFMQSRNGPKCNQTLRNATKHEFGVLWGGSSVFAAKIPMQLFGTNFCISCTSLARFAPSFLQ